MEIFDVIIIGAGPAGLFSAINIKDKKVLILEKNDIAGRKLLMTGAGKCNITHSGIIDDFFNHYGNNAKFLKKAIKKFNNADLCNFLKTNGLDITIDKNGKIFPASEKAKDIRELLIKLCEENKVIINYNEAVLTTEKYKEKYKVSTKKSEYGCCCLIIASGGKSYPSSGSSGDGYELSKHFGHNIVECRPSLAPIYGDCDFQNIAGISLPKRIIAHYRDGKKIEEYKGDILFTHNGLSGPVILDNSRYFKVGDELKINLINEKIDIFREIFIKQNSIDGKEKLSELIKRYKIPKNLINLVIKRAGITPNSQLANICRNVRKNLIKLFCEYPFIIEEIGDFNEAMATTGGVNIKGVSEQNMESKLVENLFFAGEVLDIDGDTGGYNIQAAFSTGYLAGNCISRK